MSYIPPSEARYLLDPLPPIDKVSNMIQQEANHKKLMMERDVHREQF